MQFFLKRRSLPLIFIFLIYSTINYAYSSPPLPPEQAFQVSIEKKDVKTFVTTFNIAQGYYLYRQSIHFSVSPIEAIDLNAIKVPQGKPNYDEFFGHFQALENKFDINIPLKKQEDTLDLTIFYQGCSHQGFCYPPQVKVMTLKLNKNADENANVNDHVNASETSFQSFSNIFKESLANVAGGNFSFSGIFTHLNPASVLFIFFLLGLLLAFTPCFLPMLPILAALVMGQRTVINTWRSFFLCLSFVLSMSFTYAIVGWAAGIFGTYVQAELQNPWLISLTVLLILLMAGYMFEIFNFNFLSRWQTQAQELYPVEKKGSYVGAAILGCISILMISPCVTPPLIGAIGFIAEKGNPWFGSSALFLLGLGMGVPLLLLGTIGHHYLNRLKNFSESIKYLLGWSLIGLAIYLSTRLFMEFFNTFLWAFYILSLSIALKTFIPEKDLSCMQWFKRLTGMLLFILSVILIEKGWSLKNKNLDFTQTAINETQSMLNSSSSIEVRDLETLQHVLKKAQDHRTPALLDFYADWCIACQHLEHEVLSDPKVQQALKGTQFIKVNITANDVEAKKILQQYQVIAPPTLIFISEKGQEIKEKRIVGEISANAFLKVLSSLDMSEGSRQLE